MENIGLRKATINDKATVVDFDYRLDREVGFVIFDYRFFNQGWIELIIIDEEFRGKGIGVKVFDLICEQCKADKVFTSTNRSNTQMQRALTKASFILQVN